MFNSEQDVTLDPGPNDSDFISLFDLFLLSFSPNHQVAKSPDRQIARSPHYQMI